MASEEEELREAHHPGGAEAPKQVSIAHSDGHNACRQRGHQEQLLIASLRPVPGRE